jgi:hypothetical protein
MYLNFTNIHVPWKQSNQLQHVPKMVKYDPTTNIIHSNHYSSNRPLHHYRKEGTTTNQNLPYTNSCAPCLKAQRVGVPLKMIGKNDNVENMYDCCIPGPVENVVQCEITRPARGSAIDFSGRATIRSARAPGYTYKPYYSDTYSYLRSRGNTYKTRSLLGNIIKPVTYEQTGDSEFITIFKPSNVRFKTQGAVASSSWSDRRKYNEIVKNNASLFKEYGTNFSYSKNTPYFIKSKTNKCPPCITNYKPNCHYSTNYINNINNV